MISIAGLLPYFTFHEIFWYKWVQILFSYRIFGQFSVKLPMATFVRTLLGEILLLIFLLLTLLTYSRNNFSKTSTFSVWKCHFFVASSSLSPKRRDINVKFLKSLFWLCEFNFLLPLALIHNSKEFLTSSLHDKTFILVLFWKFFISWQAEPSMDSQSVLRSKPKSSNYLSKKCIASLCRLKWPCFSSFSRKNLQIELLVSIVFGCVQKFDMSNFSTGFH